MLVKEENQESSIKSGRVGRFDRLTILSEVEGLPHH